MNQRDAETSRHSIRIDGQAIINQLIFVASLAKQAGINKTALKQYIDGVYRA